MNNQTMAENGIDYDTHLRNIPEVAKFIPIKFLKNNIRFLDYYEIFSLILKNFSILSPALLGILFIFRAAFHGLYIKNVIYYAFLDPRLFWSLLAGFAGVTLSQAIQLYFKYKDTRKLASGDIQRKFKIMQHVQVCVPISPIKSLYYFRIYVRARQDNLKYFPWKFYWAGENFDIILRNPSFYKKISDIPGNYYKLLEVFFDKPLSKNSVEIIEFCVISQNGDAASMPNYMTLLVGSRKYPIFNTFIILNLEENRSISSIRKDQFFSAQTDYSLKHDVGLVNEHGLVWWMIRPRVGWKYSLRWQNML